MRKLKHPDPGEITLVGVLSALGDPIRLSIVASLARGGERCWSDFDVPVGGSTLSHHLKVLRLAGVIGGRQESTRCYVSLRPELDTLFPGLIRSVLKAAGGRDAGPARDGQPPSPSIRPAASSRSTACRQRARSAPGRSG